VAERWLAPPAARRLHARVRRRAAGGYDFVPTPMLIGAVRVSGPLPPVRC
jgi:hypothetical protein